MFIAFFGVYPSVSQWPVPVRGGHAADRIILRRTGHHTFSAFYALLEIHAFFSCARGKNSLGWTNTDTRFTTDGTFVQIDIKGR